MINCTYGYTLAPRQLHSHLLHVGIKYACITSTAFTLAPSPTANQPSLHSPFLCPIIPTLTPTSFTGCHLVLCSLALHPLYLTFNAETKLQGPGVCGKSGQRRRRSPLLMLVTKHKKIAQLVTVSWQKAFPGRGLALHPLYLTFNAETKSQGPGVCGKSGLRRRRSPLLVLVT